MKNKRKILDSEVNAKALKKTDVNVLLKEIATAEHDLETNVTNSKVKQLMELYQKAIEYYSALDNKCFEDFLNRMTNLFKREEIQKVLSQPEEEKKEVEQETSNDTKTSTPDAPDEQQHKHQFTDSDLLLEEDAQLDQK
mmetsp:Transcript_463/g.472  ORF Transcript_463/g.472 Transcript_463/m.472 type:complete len:139 (+) Transcript_463:870-1286(+)